jgi:hypothetical protein
MIVRLRRGNSTILVATWNAVRYAEGSQSLVAVRGNKMPCWLLVEVKIEKAQIDAFKQACKESGLTLDGLTVKQANGIAVGTLRDFGHHYQLQLAANYNTNPLFRSYAEQVATNAIQNLAGEIVDRVEEPDGSLILYARVADYA